MIIKSKRLYSFILIICLITSCACYEDFKTDSLMCFSCAANETSQIIHTDNDFSNEDICTMEMLGSGHTGFLCCQSARKTSGTHRKSETLFWGLINPESLRIIFNSFISVDADIFKINTDVAEIIQFIHNKDGKKEL